MDDYSNGGMDAWNLARLGNAIDALVDRTINRPQTITGQGGYGMDAYGNLYPLGQPGLGQNVQPAQRPMNLTMLLLIAGGIYLATR